uniref:Glycine-rich protein n=1 Tax=Oryza punctata TaxID=4537 RepID=A0A0E0KHD4_ORYPU
MASTARVAALFLLLLGLSATVSLASRELMSAPSGKKQQPPRGGGGKPSVQPGYPGTNPGGAGGGIPTIPGFGSIPGMGGMGGFNVPGMGGGWGGGYGTPSGGYSRGGVVVPTVVCSERGPCYKKKVTCPKKCFSSYSSSGKGYGGGGGGGGCTIDCKTKCTAYC